MPSNVPRIDSSDAEAPSGSADGADEKLLSGDASLSTDASSTTSKCMRAARAAAACTLYLLVGPALILVNKQILSGLNFAYPMALSGLGLLFFDDVPPVRARVRRGEAAAARGRHRLFYLWNLVPVGACMASTLAFGNAVYLPARRLHPDAQSVHADGDAALPLGFHRDAVGPVGCVTAICAGTITASVGAVDAGAFSLVGVVVMFLAEATEALGSSFSGYCRTSSLGCAARRARKSGAPARPPARTPERGDVSGGAGAGQRETRAATLARVSARASPYACIPVFP